MDPPEPSFSLGRSSEPLQHEQREQAPDTSENLINRLAPVPNKAGLQGIDKDKVNSIIYEASKGSRYFENEKRKDAQLSAKIDALLNEYNTLRALALEMDQRYVDQIVDQMEAEERSSVPQFVVHCDMDSFYCSVEALSRPDLQDKPFAVGSESMLCTASYEARKFGVRSAMPGYIARKLCKDLIILPLNFDKYNAASEQIRNVFRKYDPNFCPMSLDEAYLNITAYLQEHPQETASSVLQSIRSEIFEVTQLTASACCAPNKLLAKIGSDINKPNGQFEFSHDRSSILDFMKTLPIRKIPGVGKVTETILNSMGIKTCGDILSQRVYIYKLFSRINFNFLISSALGIGSTEVRNDWERKSISVERTFSASNNVKFMMEMIEKISQELAKDVEKEGIKGRTISLKFKTAAFQVFTRAKTLNKSISAAGEFETWGKQLLKAELTKTPNLSVRLLGLRLSSLDLPSSSSNSASSMKHSDNFMDLDKFLKGETSKSSESRATIVNRCPICDAPIEGSLMKLNQHIDECLASSAKEETGCENTRVAIGVNKTESSNATRKNPPPKQSVSSNRQPSKKVTLPELFKRSPSMTVSNTKEYSCPICDAVIIDSPSMVLVNQHIDRCIGGSGE